VSGTFDSIKDRAIAHLEYHEIPLHIKTTSMERPQGYEEKASC
jgi:hypothetical protein